MFYSSCGDKQLTVCDVQKWATSFFSLKRKEKTPERPLKKKHKKELNREHRENTRENIENTCDRLRQLTTLLFILLPKRHLVPGQTEHCVSGQILQAKMSSATAIKILSMPIILCWRTHGYFKSIHLLGQKTAKVQSHKLGSISVSDQEKPS